MYQSESSEGKMRLQGRFWVGWRAWCSVDRNVVLLGLTSFFTDISSEMVATVLPLYIIFNLQLSPLQFGFVDGLYQGATVLVRLVGGIVADRWRRYKVVAAVGYGLSAICRVGMLFVGASWAAVAALVLVDRAGKGLRTAPRDALIAMSARPDELATVFGVHRAFDTAGAMLGPLVAFLLLGLVPGAFDAIFVVSFCFALIGASVLVLFVENREAEPAASELCRARHHAGHPALRCANCRLAPPVPPGASLGAAIGLLRIPRFAALVAVGALLGLTTLSDGFIFLSLQRQLGFAIGFFPLLYVISAFVYMLLAVPAGRLADRIGRGRVFILGYALLFVVYLLLLTPNLPWPALFGSVLLLGAYYAATDGVLMALVSAILPASLRASGLALIATAIGLARFCASVLFGFLWAWIGAHGALIGFVIGLLLAMAAAMLLLRSVPQVSDGL
ncbi:MAG: MFS transporter [Candidatus Competibacter sp.]